MLVSINAQRSGFDTLVGPGEPIQFNWLADSTYDYACLVIPDESRANRRDLAQATTGAVVPWLRTSSGYGYNYYVPVCERVLPEPYKWAGTYFPALYDGARGIYLTSETAHTCPHCALMRAKEIWAVGNISNRRDTAPAFVLCNIDSVNQNYLDALPDGSEPISWPPDTVANNTSTTKPEEGTISARSCGTCGFPGHNARTCWLTELCSGEPNLCHDKIGIEIEGRFVDLARVRRAAEAEGLSSADDCSISRSNSATAREFRTVPGNLHAALKQLVKYYPDESDRSCGMHVHVSFKDPSYITQLAHPKFFEYFREQFKLWGQALAIPPRHQFWARLQGRNTYCGHNIDVTDILNDDRYRQINFSSWTRHKTVECRMLPMFREGAWAVGAVQKLIEIYETWLNKEYYAQVAPLDVRHEQAIDVTPKREVAELDLTKWLPKTVIKSEQVNYKVPGPVKAGCQRVAISRDNYNILRSILKLAS